MICSTIPQMRITADVYDLYECVATRTFIELNDGLQCPISVKKDENRCAECNDYHVVITCLIKKLDRYTVVCKAEVKWQTGDGNLRVLVPKKVVDLPRVWEGVKFLRLTDYEKSIYCHDPCLALPDLLNDLNTA